MKNFWLVFWRQGHQALRVCVRVPDIACNHMYLLLFIAYSSGRGVFSGHLKKTCTECVRYQSWTRMIIRERI